MPVTQGIQVLGSWSLELKPDTPKHVRDQITTPFQQLIITPTRIDIAGMTDAAVLATARYTGVILKPGPQFRLGGAGNAWWLGIDDSKSPVTTFAVGVLSPTKTLANWMADIAAKYPLATLGTIAGGGPVGGTLTAYFGPAPWPIRRQIETICNYFQVEYRYNPNYTIDYGTASDLYGATPVALFSPEVGGRDASGLLGIKADTWEAEVDWTEFISAIQFRDYAAGGFGGNMTGVYDVNGAAMRVIGILDSSGVEPGSLSNLAGGILDRYEPVQFVRLSARDFDVRQVVQPGARVYVYDPDNGIVDSTTQVTFMGQVMFPAIHRVTEITWPIVDGMGVYVRTCTGAGPTYVTVDLSDYYVAEEPVAQVALGPASYSPIDGTSVSTSAGATVAVDQTLKRAQPWHSYTPTVTGTGTSVGDGTIVGYYRREGTTLHLRITWTFGATSTVGTGGITISLPTGMTAATNTNGYQTMPLMINDTGTADYEGKAYVASAGTTLICVVLQIPYDPTLGAPQVTYAKWVGLTATVPHTWAQTDFINLNGTIELDPA